MINRFLAYAHIKQADDSANGTFERCGNPSRKTEPGYSRPNDFQQLLQEAKKASLENGVRTLNARK